jgi:hypothetical protein
MDSTRAFFVCNHAPIQCIAFVAARLPQLAAALHIIIVSVRASATVVGMRLMVLAAFASTHDRERALRKTCETRLSRATANPCTRSAK